MHLEETKSDSRAIVKMCQNSEHFGLSVTDLGEGYHTVSSEPYFYETAYTTCMHTGAIPVDVNGWCCIYGYRNW